MEGMHLKITAAVLYIYIPAPLFMDKFQNVFQMLDAFNNVIVD